MTRANLQRIALCAITAITSSSIFYGQETGSFIIQNFTLSDFGDGYDAAQSLVWKPTFSEFVVQQPKDGSETEQTEQSGDSVIVRGNNPNPTLSAVRYAESKPDGITDIVAGTQKFVLGVKAQFTLQGYNWIELIPNRIGTAEDVAQAQINATAKADSGSTNDGTAGAETTPPDLTAESHPYRIPFQGKALEISLWAWGGQYGWWIEAYVRDYLNYQYRFPLGNLLYSGWKQKRTAVPDSVIQERKRLPATQALNFEMIKLWSFPSERVDQFYAYFDLLQQTSRVSTDIFNGKTLAEDVW